jgi:hypothetical protein
LEKKNSVFPISRKFSQTSQKKGSTNFSKFKEKRNLLGVFSFFLEKKKNDSTFLAEFLIRKKRGNLPSSFFHRWEIRFWRLEISTDVRLELLDGRKENVPEEG